MKKNSITLTAGMFTAVWITLTAFTERQNNGVLPMPDLSSNNDHQPIKNINMITDTLNMVVIRVFEAPVERVWRAWSDPEKAMGWWGPKGFTSPLAKMDFRKGGKSIVCMRSPEGYDMFNSWTFQEIIPMERIEFILNFTDKDGNIFNPADIGMPPGIPRDVPHVLTFKDLGNGKTELTITEYGYTTSADVVKLSQAGMEQCLEKMEIVVKNP